jgi:hypothetical protein
VRLYFVAGPKHGLEIERKDAPFVLCFAVLPKLPPWIPLAEDLLSVKTEKVWYQRNGPAREDGRVIYLFKGQG